MRPGQRRLALPALAFSLAIALAVPYGVAAEEPEPPGPHTQNLHLLGASLRPGAVTGPPPAGPGDVPWDTRNTDLAFWGKTVIQGRYDGFRVIDVREPDNPRELAFFECVSDQGDVGIWRNLVFRSVNSGQQTDECRTTPQPMSRGWEGIQIFDISDLQDIRQVGAVPLDCGSHTHTVVPDLSENRVLIYNSTSQSNNEAPGPFPNQCSDPFNRFDIVEVPLDAPDTAQVIGSASLGVGHDGMPIEMCHDIGVIQGPAVPYNAGSGGIGEWVALGRIHLGREDHRSRLGAGRRDTAAVPGDRRLRWQRHDHGRDEDHLLPRRDNGRGGGSLGPATATVAVGELHDPQLQHRAAQEPVRPRPRLVPIRNQRGRFHRPDECV
jgi:hypothetical protein